MQAFKYIVRNTAEAHGQTATFMPKPLAGDGGSGMHAHQSLWKDGKPLFYDETSYAGLSKVASYIGGLLKHAPAVLALTNPTVNSYRRLYSGFEAPVNLAYSQSNRSAANRIPLTGDNPKAKRIEPGEPVEKTTISSTPTPASNSTTKSNPYAKAPSPKEFELYSNV